MNVPYTRKMNEMYRGIKETRALPAVTSEPAYVQQVIITVVELRCD